MHDVVSLVLVRQPMMPRPGVPYVFALFAFVVSSCGGCKGESKGDPSRYIAKDAEAVLEIRDLGALAKHKQELAAAIADVIPAEQISALEHELDLSLGFTPTTEKGLEDAGLPKEGPIAVELAGGGSSALWIVPVKDAAKVTKTIESIAKNRASVDAVDKVKIGEHEVTLMQTSFGPEKALVVAYTIDGNTALIGAGAKGRALLERALTRKKEDGSIADNAEYAAIDKSLPQDWTARMISPSAGTSLNAMRGTLVRIAPGRVARLLESLPEPRGVKSAGWALSFEKRAAKIDGRIRLDDQALADMKAIFATKSPAPPGVSGIAFEDAVLFAYFSGDPQALLAEVAPAGSAMRARLDESFAQVKKDIDTDVEKDLLPVLSGHVAVSMGLGNLGGQDLKALLENPAAVLWTVIALGAADPEKLLVVEKKMDAPLTARGLVVATRKTGGHEVRVLQGQREGQPPAMIVETVSAGGARIFSNEEKKTEAGVERAGGSPKDPHDGKNGLVVEARLNELAKAMRTLDFSALPVLYRAIAAKVVQLLGVFEKVEVRVAPAPDGAAFSARVALMPAAVTTAK